MENLRMRKKALDAASWFDEFLESWVRPLDVFWLPTGVLIILLIGIFFWYHESPNSSTQSAIAGATAAFVVAYMTLVNLWHARRNVTIASASRKDASLPVLKAGPVVRSTNVTWSVEVKNIGKGPATNIDCYIDFPELVEITNPPIKLINGVPQKPTQSEVVRMTGITKTEKDQLGALGLETIWSAKFSMSYGLPADWTIHIEYLDIFRRNFCSKLIKTGGGRETTFEWFNGDCGD
jgi:hypothetical protein